MKRTVTVMTHQQLKRFAREASRRRLNRQLNVAAIDRLNPLDKFPITQAVMVDDGRTMRCTVVLDAQGGTGELDLPLENFLTFEKVQVAP